MVINSVSNQYIIFSETELKNRLAALHCSKIVAFAASCAERLIPVYARYAEKASLVSQHSSIYRNALDAIWSNILGAEMERYFIENMEKTCVDAIPSEDDSWSFGEPYAEDAGAAVVFTIRAWLFCDPQEAAYAAKRIYEAVDNFVVSSINSSLFEEQILAHPLIQKELACQQYDLKQLEIKPSSSIEQATIIELRTRIETQRDYVFGEQG